MKRALIVPPGAWIASVISDNDPLSFILHVVINCGIYWHIDIKDDNEPITLPILKTKLDENPLAAADIIYNKNNVIVDIYNDEIMSIENLNSFLILIVNLSARGILLKKTNNNITTKK